MPKLKSELLLILIGLLIGLGIIEVGIRLIGYYPKVLIPPNLYENHPRTWWTLRPNFAAKIDTPDGQVTYQINSQGIRASHDFDPHNKQNLKRLFIIGDSLTFGWGVNEEHTFPRIMNDALARQGISLEVVNLGVPGFGTMHSYERLLEYSSLLGKSNYVVYAFVSNDPVDNISGKKVVVDGIRIDEHMPNKVLLSKMAHVYQRVRFFSVLVDFYYDNFANPRYLKRQQLQSTHSRIENRADFLATSEYLLKIIDWTKRNDIEFFVLITGYSEYSEPLIETLQAHEIPVIIAEEIFSRFNVDNRPVFLIDRHWNKDGHQFIAAGLETLVIERWQVKNGSRGRIHPGSDRG
jgi:hypothetical protein